MLQSIHFDKTYYKLREAKDWLLRHGILPIKRVHKTGKFWEFRIINPTNGRYYSKYIDTGILFIFVR